MKVETVKKMFLHLGILAVVGLIALGAGLFQAGNDCQQISVPIRGLITGGLFVSIAPLVVSLFLLAISIKEAEKK